MARAIWSGAISFGLVNIPIKLYPAVQSKTVSFNQIDAKTQSRVKYKKVSAADPDREVPNDDIVKGYEVSPGNYVTIEPNELEALDPKASRTVEIEEFVDLDKIDPIFYDSPYQIAPAAGAAKPYKLLVEAMEGANKVAIARFVMRSKQYLAALRPKEGKLLLSTMHYADEVSDSVDGEYADLEDVEVSAKERKMAEQLIESLSADFEPERFRDEYRDKVLDLIEQKAAGRVVAVVAPEDDGEKVVDLMAALEASVKAAKESRVRHPTARGDERADDEEEAAEAAPAPRRKRRSA